MHSYYREFRNRLRRFFMCLGALLLKGFLFFLLHLQRIIVKKTQDGAGCANSTNIVLSLVNVSLTFIETHQNQLFY